MKYAVSVVGIDLVASVAAGAYIVGSGCFAVGIELHAFVESRVVVVALEALRAHSIGEVRAVIVRTACCLLILALRVLAI